MELDLQEWLMLILGVVIVGVLVHGFWVQYFGSDRLPLKLDKQFASDPGSLADGDSLSQFKAELPNGGARIVTVGDSSIPVSNHQPPRAVPSQGQAAAQNTSSEGSESAQSDDAAIEQATTQSGIERNVASDLQIGDQKESLDAALDREISADEYGVDARAKAPATQLAERSSVIQDAEPYYVVLNVLGDIEGPMLLREITALDFEFGDKAIFHRYDDAGREKISIANAVEPGSFDPDVIESLSTPGVTLFMCASECQDAPAVFEEMLYVAVRLADSMGARLCDDRRTIMSEHSVAELRQQVQEYQFSGSR